MQPKITPWAFVLAVPDLDRSTAYFRDVLGFRVLWEDATEWRLVQRDSVRVMLGHCPNDMPPSDLGSHNWFGMREVVVTTADRHRIVFGQEVKDSSV
jgi:catechol 2,3-dioxygenase-like lactoylglutathione lyase family enzyme